MDRSPQYAVAAGKRRGRRRRERKPPGEERLESTNAGLTPSGAGAARQGVLSVRQWGWGGRIFLGFSVFFSPCLALVLLLLPPLSSAAFSLSSLSSRVLSCGACGLCFFLVILSYFESHSIVFPLPKCIFLLCLRRKCFYIRLQMFVR